MKIILTGANGQLGSDLLRLGCESEHEVIPFNGRGHLDVSNAEQVNDAVSRIQPDVLINTAARCDVDACEDDILRAFEVNAVGACNLAQACQRARCKCIHISTDYVFSGEQTDPFSEADVPNPVNAYGISKLAGEYFVSSYCTDHLIVRSSGLYGKHGSREKSGNFVETMIRLSNERNSIQCVSDQFLSPTYTLDLAQAVLKLVDEPVSGLLHVCNEGVCSWLEWATEIYRLLDRSTKIEPISLEEYKTKARRPKFTALENKKLKTLTILTLPSWKNALERYLLEAGHLKMTI